MTDDRELGRLLDRWFEDGPIEAADRVIDVVADRIGRQPQVPAWRATRRFRPMFNSIKLVGAAAGVVVAAGLALYMLGTPGGSGGHTPSPSAVATPSASVASSPAASITCEDDLAGCAGPLAAGEHQSSQFSPGLSYATPDGWRNVIDTASIFKLDPSSAYPYILAWGDASIALQDAECSATPDPTRGRKAADWIAMFTSHPGLDASGPVSVEMFGNTAQQVEIALHPGWTAVCPQHSGPYVEFLTQSVSGTPSEYGLGSTERVLVTVVDIGRRTVVILAYGPVAPETFATSMQSVRSIIASFRFSCTVADGPCGTP
jgi:hypothetical protein